MAKTAKSRTSKLFQNSMAEISGVYRRTGVHGYTEEVINRIAKELGINLRTKKTLKTFRGRVMKAVQLESKPKPKAKTKKDE